MNPASAANMTINGNGTASHASASSANTAMAMSQALRSTRVPMRHPAKATMATTAGFMPEKNAAIAGTLP
jgi:hypothetical protein